eukprot:1838042-Prymnesium_polylepis.1
MVVATSGRDGPGGHLPRPACAAGRCAPRREQLLRRLARPLARAGRRHARARLGGAPSNHAAPPWVIRSAGRRTSGGCT